MSLTYTSIFQAINSSLGVDINKFISPLHTLSELGVDELDIADILFRLDIPIQNYFSAGANKLTQFAREELANAAYSSLMQRNTAAVSSLLKIRDCQNLDDLLKNTTPVDLFHLCNYYHETHHL